MSGWIIAGLGLACRVNPGEEGPVSIDAEDLSQSALQDFGINHLLPMQVAIDPVARRTYSVSDMSDSLALIDVDASELLDVVDLAIDVDNARLSVDGRGVVYVATTLETPLAEGSSSTLICLDPLTGDLATAEGYDITTGVVGLPSGGAIASVSLAEQDLFLRVDRDCAVQGLAPAPGAAHELRVTPEGQLVAVLGKPDETNTLAWIDPDRLEVVRECPAPFYSIALYPLAGDRFALASQGRVGIASCDEEALQIEQGSENVGIVPHSEGFLVFDRTAGPSGGGANWGEGRIYDKALRPVGDPITVGKHGGFVGWDPIDMVAWVSSEGTAEVWAVDVETPEVLDRIRTGVHVEGIAPDPDRPWRVGFTGRLSSTVGWIDLRSGEVATRQDVTTWPICPVLRGDSLWVVGQLASNLVELDAQTLDVLGDHDLGYPENVLMLFDSLALHPGRDTLFVSNSQANQLVEFDPDLGEEVGRWDLPSPAQEDPGAIGRLEIVVAGDLVVVLNNYTGGLSLIDPDRAQPLDEGHGAVIDTTSKVHFQLARASADGEVLYVGGSALSLPDLERVPELDLAVGQVIADLGDGRMLGWDDGEIVALDVSGHELGRTPLDRPQDADVPIFAWTSSQPDWLLLTDQDNARVEAMPVRTLNGMDALEETP